MSRLLQLVLLFGLFVHFSCQNNTPQAQNQESEGATEAASSSPAPSFSPQLQVRLQCDPAVNIQGMDKHQLWIRAGSQKTPLLALNACSPIRTADYGQYGIPSGALAATGGWFAGGGDYFYVESTAEGSFNCFQGWIDEGQQGNDYHYKIVMQLDKDGKVLPQYNPRRFEGVYTLGGQETSWMVLIYPFKGLLKGFFYEIKGGLPPSDAIKTGTADFKQTNIEHILLNPYDLSFQSDLGAGFFKEEAGGQYSISFSSKKSQQNKVLTLRIDERYNE
ncbi:MAG: hypothetical protein AAFP19_16710 [Bacteroidota bacterium]